MPIYDYQCPRCGEVLDVWAGMNEPRKVHEECGATMTRVISAPFVHPDLAPYLDVDMDRRPVWVKSKKHRATELKVRGLGIRN